MGPGVIRLLRTPLREGEEPYAITNVDQGLHKDGFKKGEKMPLTHRHAQVLQDGRMLWELPNTDANRKLAESMLPTIPNPPFAYSVEYPPAAGEAAKASPALDPVKVAKAPKAPAAPRKPKAAKAVKESPVVQNADPQPAPPASQEEGRKPSRSKGKTASGGK
jgi:hypothetical protein